MRKTLLFLASALLCTDWAAAQTRELSGSGELLDRIVAVVNEGIVLQSELEARTESIVANLRQQETQLPPRSLLRRQILERLIIEQIQLQRAERLKLEIGDQELNNALRSIAERNGLSFPQLPEALAAQGIDYAVYRQEARRDLTLSKLLERDVLRNIVVSPREIEQYLEKQAAAPEKHTEYRLSHILIALPLGPSPEQLAAAEEEAREITRRVREGESFEQLAVAYSDAPDALEGGDLGWRSPLQIPSVFADAVPRLEAGEVSEPLRSASGFHLVKVGAIRGGGRPSMVAQFRARHIILQTNEVLDDAAVRERLRQIRKRIVEDGEDFTSIAAAVSEDQRSAAEGGDLGWQESGAFVPEFEEVVLRLEPGEVSEPFRTPFGWHIAELLGERTHDNSADIERREAYNRIFARKREEETAQWLRSLRDQAFVEIRL